MKRVFADSFYFFAILNPNDAAHRRALEFASKQDEPIVTTAIAMYVVLAAFSP